jgi:hypothetical protein
MPSHDPVASRSRRAIELPILGFSFWVYLGGCTSAPIPDNPAADPPARADEAASVVWTSLGSESPLPPIHWVGGDCLTPSLSTVHCELGRYIEGEVWVLVRAEAEDPPSRTSLAHELMHASLDRIWGDPDPNHTRPEWGMLSVLQNDLVQRGM